MHFTLLLSNIKTALIIGIILAVFHFLGLLVGLSQNTLVTLYYTILYYFDIVANLLGMVSAYILIYGAYKRNSTALMVYMVSTIVMIILLVVRTVFAILAVMDLTAFASNETYAVSMEQKGVVAAVGTGVTVISLIWAVGQILFDVWTIIVAKNAKIEIEFQGHVVVSNGAAPNYTAPKMGHQMNQYADSQIMTPY